MCVCVCDMQEALISIFPVFLKWSVRFQRIKWNLINRILFENKIEIENMWFLDEKINFWEKSEAGSKAF